MGELGVRDALGGRWAVSLKGCLVLFLPATLVVIFQETTSGFPNFGLVLLSALGQQVTAGLIVLVVAGATRRRTSPIPLIASIAVWIAIGVSRGVVGGLFVVWFGAGDPHFPARIITWVGIAVIWMPAFVFTAAQLDHRRLLLAEFLTERRLLAEQRKRSTASAEAWGEGVITALRYSVGPVIEEIRSSLSTIAPQLDPPALKAISQRLARLSDDAADLVNEVPLIEQPVMHSPMPKATWAEATRFTQHRPFIALLVGTAAMAAVLLPVSFAARRPPLAGDVARAILASVTVIVVAILVRRALPMRLRSPGLLPLTLGYLAAGLAGSTALALMGLSHEDPFRVLLVLVWPLAVMVTALLVPVMTGVAGANAMLVEQLTSVAAERGALTEWHKRRDEQARQHLSTILHGPLHGRLAACAMALSFLSTAEAGARRKNTAFITEAVMGHLASASSDLQKLRYQQEPDTYADA